MPRYSFIPTIADKCLICRGRPAAARTDDAVTADWLNQLSPAHDSAVDCSGRPNLEYDHGLLGEPTSPAVE
jgi:hypothetical protein